jgi:hypothetical protein
MVAEGAALAAFGPRYLDFMERNGLMDVGKRLLRKLNVRSSTALTGIGLAEAVWGLVLMRRATALRSAPAGRALPIVGETT